MPAAGDLIRASDILDRVGVRLRRVANQSVNNTTATSISWDTEDQDTDSFITATSTTITVPTGFAGVYAITFYATGAVTGRSYGDILVTSSLSGIPGNLRTYMDPSEDRVVCSVCTPLAEGDSFVCQVFHSTGAAANFTAWLSCFRVSV